jgi:hypothetical protein
MRFWDPSNRLLGLEKPQAVRRSRPFTGTATDDVDQRQLFWRLADHFWFGSHAILPMFIRCRGLNIAVCAVQAQSRLARTKKLYRLSDVITHPDRFCWPTKNKRKETAI